MTQACAIGLHSVSTVGQVQNMSAQPDQIIRFSYNSFVQPISAVKLVRKATVCHVRK